MKNWIKGVILMIVGNVLTVWISDYLLSQPNPLYSVGSLLEDIPRIQDTLTSDVGLLLNILGILIIFYGLYLFIKDVNRWA